MLTHANLIGAVSGLSYAVQFYPKNDEFVFLGYLPLAHILEMACEMYILMQGGCVGYGSSKTLFVLFFLFFFIKKKIEKKIV